MNIVAPTTSQALSAKFSSFLSQPINTLIIVAIALVTLFILNVFLKTISMAFKIFITFIIIIGLLWLFLGNSAIYY